MKAPVILVFAKTPIPGRVKTRLCPPLGPVQASRLYSAFLDDTLRMVESARLVARRVIAYDGDMEWFNPWLDRFELTAQVGADLGERLWNTFKIVLGNGPVICIGSDSPHLDARLLERAVQTLDEYEVVLGPSTDGGYYLVGLNRAVDLFQGLPMSTPELLQATLERASVHGLQPALLPEQTDLDYWEDVLAMHAFLPAHSANMVAQLEMQLAQGLAS